MSSVINFFKRKIKKCTNKTTYNFERTKLDDPIQNTNNVSRRKCRRSNTTVAYPVKSNSIIDYFTKLELINPNRKKELKSFSGLEFKIKENDVSTSRLNNTANKNDIEKIQDLFFDDEDTMDYDSYKKSTNVISSYMDSPVSASSGSEENSIEKSYFHVPSSSPASELEADKSKSNLSNHSVEKLRRSVSTPGLKDVNLSIFSNISNIQIKESDIETEFNNIKDLELSDKSIENEIKPQFIRGGKTRSSKNIKQLFKNVVNYQMNALNSLEKFYESQLNKLEDDRKQNLNMNPSFSDKINEFYDRQLNMLEERVQSNLNLICENKRNRLSSASSSSTITGFVKTNNLTRLNNDYQANPTKMVKIVKQNDIKQANRTRTLNDLKFNLKNQNNLLPSKCYNKMSLNDDSERNKLAFQQLKQGNTENTEEYSVAKFRSPKVSALVYSNNFYKKQSILQSPISNDSFKLNTPKKEIAKPLYQKNKIKRYSTSNENLAQISNGYQVKNNLAKIVKLNRVDECNTSKHQSVCSLNSDIDFKTELKTVVIDQDDYDFKSINSQNMLNCNFFEIQNHVMQSRFSDSHLLFEMRQNHVSEVKGLYQKKGSKSFFFETKV